jgi:hypothetical protein
MDEMANFMREDNERFLKFRRAFDSASDAAQKLRDAIQEAEKNRIAFAERLRDDAGLREAILADPELRATFQERRETDQRLVLQFQARADADLAMYQRFMEKEDAVRRLLEQKGFLPAPSR